MIQHSAFAPEPWALRETELDLERLAQTESIFALSNGHIGLRGNLDEGEPHGLPGTYLNAFYEVRPLPYPEGGYGYPEAGQTLVNVTKTWTSGSSAREWSPASAAVEASRAGRGRGRRGDRWPEALELADAVTLLADGRTAPGLTRQAEIAAGQTVLVEAAVGGVGSLLVQFATWTERIRSEAWDVDVVYRPHRQNDGCPVQPSRAYTARVPDFREAIQGAQLDRHSFVPLYYQLQEVLKQQIESGQWQPGDALPSEPELARTFQVSRIVVRQALAILEDDHQIVRIRGRGTFVAQPKLNHRAGGLSRLLTSPRGPDVSIQVLDKRTAPVESSIRRGLELDDETRILRVTTLLSLRAMPLAISYSFFAAHEVPWLDAAAQVGRNLPPDLTLADHGVELADSQLAIEASQCGQFEADRFGIAHRSAVFLVLCTELRRAGERTPPFEVARVEYRGDLLRFKLQTRPDGDGLGATFELEESAEALLGSAT
jgi:DNA-binding GntR family transcriptional regulator